MSSLYEIDQSMLDCVDMETGEIIDAEKLEALQMERDEKIEKVALWYKNLCSDAEAYKKEKDSLAEKQKAAENKAESLKKWIDNACNGNQFKTTKVDIKYRKSETVDIEDENAFVDWAMRTENDDLLKYSAPTPNKTAIKQAIKSGLNVECASIQQKNNINIK